MQKAFASFDYGACRVVVTGASGGLGAAIATAFAEAGASVAFHYRSGRDRAEAVIAALPHPERHLAVGAEATSEAEVARAAGLVREWAGDEGLDALVNNAGSYPSAPLLELGAAAFSGVVDSSLLAAHLFTRALAPLMAPGSAIVNVASIEAHRPARGHAHYAAAKAALVQYTRSCARELSGLGIRANCLSPGLVWRDGLPDSWSSGYEAWMSACPAGRAGLPGEIASACLFLASGAASFVNGAELVVDGGALCVSPQDPATWSAAR
ncbi:MAG: SDR family oxidoreductase [Spirochaetes bacterium]|nr:SDR family oxidoreductase [Spirochaetota bacterium]